MVKSNIFKNNWEKSNQRYHPSDAVLHAMVSMAFPGKSLLKYQIIEGGCANLNIQIHVTGECSPFILRLYLRDSRAAQLEKAIGDQLAPILSTVPKIYFVGTYEDITFSIAEYKQGITLRDALIKHQCPIQPIMEKVGYALSQIQSVSFPTSGFFGESLKPLAPISRKTYSDFFQEAILSNKVAEVFSGDDIAHMKTLFHNHMDQLPQGTENRLVHGDFDPANILVSLSGKEWDITAILDWEFSFSGSPLHDVANMIRYAHRLPGNDYESAFLKGLEEGGYVLPKNWRVTIHLLNLLALLDSLNRCDLKKSPKQVLDISDLIRWIVRELE